MYEMDILPVSAFGQLLFRECSCSCAMVACVLNRSQAKWVCVVVRDEVSSGDLSKKRTCRRCNICSVIGVISVGPTLEEVAKKNNAQDCSAN